MTCHVADTVHVADAGWCEGEGRRRIQDHEWMDLALIDVVASTNARLTGAFHATLHRSMAHSSSCIATRYLRMKRPRFSHNGTSNGMHGMDRLQVERREQRKQHARAFNTAVGQMDPRVHTSPATVR